MEEPIKKLLAKKMLLEGEIAAISGTVRDLKRKKQEKMSQDIKHKFKLSSEHIKLLKHMEFVFYENGGDAVIIGVDGKRPFGNSNVHKDIAKILEWVLPNDDLSNKQYDKAERLLRELPLALNQIIGGLS